VIRPNHWIVVTEKTRVLFVDDEPQVLRGLQNMMRKDRERWDLAFALGSEVALAELSQRSFDVVISDMRMPGMDGAELLALIKRQWPSTVRIMLSGESDRASIARALPSLHQFIAKPCDGATLRSIIERSVRVISKSADVQVRAAIGSVDKLPTPSRLYFELSHLVSSPMTTISQVAQLVAEDPAMTAKILQLVNSAFFGIAEHTTSVSAAVSYLGVDLIRYLALSQAIFASVDREPFAGFSTDHIQRTSLQTAALARKIVRGTRRDEAFVAGLLHDLGQVVLAITLGETYAAVAEVVRITGEPLTTVERDFLGVTHAEVGAYLLGIWGLPAEIVAGVGYHHAPGSGPPEYADVVTAVHVADALVDTSCMGEPTNLDRLDRAYLERAGLTEQLAAWCALVDG
jgi:HD-like signal output (HDOD) protein